MFQGRNILALTATLLAALPPACGFATDPHAALRNDAQLTSVHFIDNTHGWCIGDRGTIWHTVDGGAHWQLQPTGVDCRLAAVQFIDRKTGVAAGGFTQPYTHVSTGVILRTRDGGEHWTIDRQSSLPAIRSLKFIDGSHGWAIGQASAMFPTGVFTTDDGGRSWTSLPPHKNHAWDAGDFSDGNTGVVVGRQGSVGAIRRKAIESIDGADFGLRNIAQVRLSSPTQAWLVGNGGLVMRSDDTGSSWQSPHTAVPTELRNQFDFAALAVRGDKLWIAGSPGSHVLHSPDGGKSWSAQPTGQNIPLRDMTFIDDRRGWAVGDLGVILATKDGGQSWHIQHAGGARAALVGVFSQPSDLPLEMFAKLSGDDSYLSVACLLNRTDVGTSDAEDSRRIHEATVQTGACAAETAWRFPLPQSASELSAEQLIERWNQATDGHALERIDEHLVRTIRTWRPNVVVTQLPRNGHDDPLAQLINQLTLRAVEHAADPSLHAEQIAAAGLEAWKVQRVFGTLGTGETGSIAITSDDAMRDGRSISDVATPARGLMNREFTPSPPTVGFRMLLDSLPKNVGQRDMFSGIALSPGGEARRAWQEFPDPSVDAIRRSTQTRRNLQAILARHDDRGDDYDSGRYLAEVSDLTRRMENSHGAEVLMHMAQRYFRRGQWELAADTFNLIVDRYPDHPASGAALVWLVQYHASAEAGWRVGQRQTLVKAESGNGGELRAQHSEVKRASAVLTLGGDDRAARASGYAKQLEASSAALGNEPQVRFPLAVAHRQQGYPRQAERFYIGYVRGQSHDAWWECANAEQQLLTPDSDRESMKSPKPIWHCAATTEKPRLDGKLNDTIWRRAKPVDLRSPQRDDDAWPAVAMLAYDNEFLYLAVSCQRPSSAKVEAATGARSRDSDLTGQDRIELYLDIDRDYVTAYRLAIDSRGWTNDSCWGDASWNPQWFVAAKSDGTDRNTSWTAEAAIPLSELARDRPTVGAIWAANIQRIAPQAGFQSWSTPAANPAIPEASGWLQFTP